MSYADKVWPLPQTPEIGVCFSSEKATPTYADEHHFLGTSIEKYYFTLYDLDPGTTYYYCAYVKLGDEVFYGNVKSIMTFGEKSTTTIINGHKFVDLGLPSGLLWARTNVGAASSVDDGDYFAWGETEPKSYYISGNYKWGDNYMTKYNSKDWKTALDSEDDAATVNWGVPCRMPNSSEFEELTHNCEWNNRNNNGRDGYLVTGPNGNSIFFPFPGYRIRDVRYSHGSTGWYWSRSLYSREYNSFARCLRTSENGYGVDPTKYDARECGFTVRAVAKK